MDDWETRCSSIVTLRGIADKHDYDFTIPPSDFNDEWNDHQLFEVFKLPNLKVKGRVGDKFLQERQFNYDPELVEQCPDDVSLYGYFQTERYFSHLQTLSKRTSHSKMM